MSDAVDAINAALGLDADSLSAEHPPRLIYVDSDGNGTVDGCIEVFPNGKVRRWLDANEDGKWDTLVIDADGAIITVEDDPERLSWSDPDGTVTRVIDTMTLTPPLSEPQGIARDPRTGHLLIVDDWEGTNSLYEFDKDGALLNTASLLEYGNDPEGIAIRPGADELFIAFDSGAKIVSFTYTPTLPEGSGDLPVAADCAFF